MIELQNNNLQKNFIISKNQKRNPNPHQSEG